MIANLRTYEAWPRTRLGSRPAIKPLREQRINNLLRRIEGRWIRMRKCGDHSYISRHCRVRNAHQMQWCYRLLYDMMECRAIKSAECFQ